MAAGKLEYCGVDSEDGSSSREEVSHSVSGWQIHEGGEGGWGQGRGSQNKICRVINCNDTNCIISNEGKNVSL